MKSFLCSRRAGELAAVVLASAALYALAATLLMSNNTSGWYEGWMLYANLPGNRFLQRQASPPTQFAGARAQQASVHPAPRLIGECDGTVPSNRSAYGAHDNAAAWPDQSYDVAFDADTGCACAAGELCAMAAQR